MYERRNDGRETEESVVGDLIVLCRDVLESAGKTNDSLQLLKTSVAIMGERMKTIEKIIWPLVIAALTGMVGAFFALITER